MLNTIAGGFIECKISSLTQKEQTRKVMVVNSSPNGIEGSESEDVKARIPFLDKDVVGIHP